MRTNLTTRVSALESDVAEIKSGVTAILAQLQANAPAKTTPARKAPAKAAKPAETEFVGWLRETAEARKARKTSNAEMAAWMRSKGLVPNGAAWEAAKKGERSIKVLKKLA